MCGEGTIASGGQVLATRIIDSERERLRDYLAANAALTVSSHHSKSINLFPHPSGGGTKVCV